MAIDPVTGHIFIVFYDRRNYYCNGTDVYLARSTDGGDSFSNTRISEMAFFPSSGVFFGDYIHIAAYNGKVFPIWMRMDNYNLSIWSAIVTDSDAAFGGVMQELSFEDSLQVVGSPQSPGIKFSVVEHGHVSIQLFDVLGRKIGILLDGYYAPGNYRISIPQYIPDGEYFARMESVGSLNVAVLSIIR